MVDEPGRLIFPTAEFLDVNFDLVTRARVQATIVEREPGEPFAYIVTPNVDHVVRLQNTRSDLWSAYRLAWMTLCDSRILARLARFAGLVLPVVPGSDLTMDLFRTGIRSDDRIAILGGDNHMVAELRRRHGLTNVVHHVPPMGFIDNAVEVSRALEFLITSHARYSFIAIGSPQQEIVAYKVARSGKATGIGLCIGASLEFLIGRQVRAPKAFQMLGLEWMFRLLLSPRRLWRRYLVEGPNILLVFANWRRRLA